MKKYQQKGDDERCYPLSYFKDVRPFEDKDLHLTEMQIEYNTDHFYCSEYHSLGIKDDGECGNECEGYNPRNGKNGRCKHSRNCYIPTDKEFKLTKENKLVKINE